MTYNGPELQEKIIENCSENTIEINPDNANNFLRLSDTTTCDQVEQNINASFIRLQKGKKKLPDNIKEALKKSYNGHWNNDKKVFSIPIENKILANTFLTNESLEYILEDGHDSFFDLDPTEQEKERLKEAENFKSAESIKKILVPLQTCVDDYNKYYGKSLKIKDFENKTLNDLSEGVENTKQLERLKLLFDVYRKWENSKDDIKLIQDKIKNSSSRKKK